MSKELHEVLGLEYDETAMLEFLVLGQQRLEAQMVDLAQALADLKTATEADAKQKQELLSQVSTLKQQIADLGTAEAASLQSAADSVEAAAQALQPITVPDVPVPTAAGVPVVPDTTTATAPTEPAPTDASTVAPSAADPSAPTP